MQPHLHKRKSDRQTCLVHVGELTAHPLCIASHHFKLAVAALPEMQPCMHAMLAALKEIAQLLGAHIVAEAHAWNLGPTRAGQSASSSLPCRRNTTEEVVTCEFHRQRSHSSTKSSSYFVLDVVECPNILKRISPRLGRRHNAQYCQGRLAQRSCSPQGGTPTG